MLVIHEDIRRQDKKALLQPTPEKVCNECMKKIKNDVRHDLWSST